MNIKKNKLPDIHVDFSQWYQEIVFQSGLAEQTDVKGCIIVCPYGCSLWESVTFVLNQNIKKMGALNMLFPMLIPYSYFEKEKEHIDGFAPEVAIVTKVGNKELEEPFIVRPTSEVIIHDFFRRKINSWRDLPLKINQWCSVVRWEKRPRAFLRTTEFWWQEGHTAHESYEEAELQTLDAINMYAEFCYNFLAIPVIKAKKPRHERFAGAETTWTIEGMMQDGRALQMGTSHLLGSGFAKAQDMKFQDKNMNLIVPHLTSWGVTTRLIGAIIMVHGDQQGIVMPPFIAPILFFLVPICKNQLEYSAIMEKFNVLEKIFNSNNISYQIDKNYELAPGSKFFESELKGIPFRIEIGIRDLESNLFTLYQRDINKKEKYSLHLLDDEIQFIMFIENFKKDMHCRMLDKAINYKKLKTLEIDSINEIKQFNNGNNFYITYWCGFGESFFKELQLSVRCVLEENIFEGKWCCLHGQDCIASGLLQQIIIAKAY